jgi:hypothetical protein
MRSVSPRRGRVRALAALALVTTAAATCPLACGDLGEPAFEGVDGAAAFDTGVPMPVSADAADAGAEATVRLRGLVLDPATGEPLGHALVAIEIGGLNRVNPGAIGPDGGVVPTLSIDPFYQLGALADEAGKFSLEVPDETLGVHAYTSGFFCGVPDGGAIQAETGTVSIRPRPLPDVDANTARLPTITGFTISPAVAGPGDIVQLTALVEAADPENDPLSEQVLAIEPTSGWAGIFAPPTRGIPGVGYPNGVYGRLFTAPLGPGEYTFYMVAATESCVVSEPVEQTLIVTSTGDGGLDGPDDALQVPP